MNLLRYGLFLVPMLVAGVWIARRHGFKQALYDLLAFNLLFSFDFADLLPGNSTMRSIHLLMLAILGYQLLRSLTLGKIRLSLQLLQITSLSMLFLVWMTGATLINKTASSGLIGTLSYIIINYALSVMFLFVGIRLAHDQAASRFVRVMLIASVIVAGIALVQTGSDGRLLTSNSSDYYLGIFQPLGDKRIARRDVAEVALNFGDAVRTIRFGNLSFYRAAGSYDGAAYMLFLASIVLIGFMLSRQIKMPKWVPVALIITTAGFVASFSRTMIATFALLACALILIRFRDVISRRVLSWVAGVVLVLLTLVAFVPPITQVVSANLDGLFGARGERDINSLNGRTVLWSYVIGQIQAHPLTGSDAPITAARAGWGASTDEMLDVGAHNIILDYTYRGGLPAGVALCVLLVLSLWRALALWLSPALTASQRQGFLIVLLSGVGFLLVNLMSAPMKIPQLGAIFWIGCGYLAAASFQQSSAGTVALPVGYTVLSSPVELS